MKSIKTTNFTNDAASLYSFLRFRFAPSMRMKRFEEVNKYDDGYR